jgi:hypothetical protein
MKTIKQLKYILLLTVTMGFASCERDALNVELPSIEPKLVVQGFVSPQEAATKIYVSISSPVFGNIPSENWVADATVKITDGSIVVPLQLDATTPELFYFADSNTLKIRAGATYTLWVNTPDGKSVSSKCTVPFPADIASLTYNWDTTVVNNGTSGGIERTVRLNMEWKDIAAQTNYYRSGAYVVTYTIDNPTTFFNEQMYNSSYTDLQTDKNKDGSIMAKRDLTAVVTEYVGGQTGSFSFRPKGIILYLVNCDENYYKFQETALKNDSGDPFSEPVLVHNNILGGLGYFGACNQYIHEINF